MTETETAIIIQGSFQMQQWVEEISNQINHESEIKWKNISEAEKEMREKIEKKYQLLKREYTVLQNIKNELLKQSHKYKKKYKLLKIKHFELKKRFQHKATFIHEVKQKLILLSKKYSKIQNHHLDSHQRIEDLNYKLNLAQATITKKNEIISTMSEDHNSMINKAGMLIQEYYQYKFLDSDKSTGKD